MKKNNKGFTLVELIVVIVILGILAAVAVPAYSGYISRSRRAADLSVLSSVATAAQAIAAEKQTTLTNVLVKREATGTGDDAMNDMVTITLASGTATGKDVLTLANGGQLPTFTANDWNTATFATTGSNANQWVFA